MNRIVVAGVVAVMSTYAYALDIDFVVVNNSSSPVWSMYASSTLSEVYYKDFIKDDLMVGGRRFRLPLPGNGSRRNFSLHNQPNCKFDISAQMMPEHRDPKANLPVVRFKNVDLCRNPIIVITD